MNSKIFTLIFTGTIFLAFIIPPTNSESIKYGEICHSTNHSGHSHEQVYSGSGDYNDHSWNSDNYLDPEFSDYCDFGNGLCIDNKCQCEKPDMMVYNPRLCQCGAPTNSFCNEDVPCLSGNVCQNNICVCPNPSTQLADGGCSGNIYDVCQRDSDCSQNSFLSCIEGNCFCSNSRMSLYEMDTKSDSYVGENGACRIRSGELCSHVGQACVSNSKCKLEKEGQQSICQCDSGYLPTDEGTCRKDYDQSCITGFHECNENRGLICINDTCQCIDSDTFYDKIMRGCVTSIGKLCGNAESVFLEKYTIGCVQNAKCISDSSGIYNSRKVCKCQIGFVPEESEGKACTQVPAKEVL